MSSGCPLASYRATEGPSGPPNEGEHTARQFAIVFGPVYVLIGILGLILPIPLLGIFGVTLLHDIVHLAIGSLWLVAAFAAPMGPDSAPKTSQLIGIVYLLVAILGFALPTLMDQLLVINTADTTSCTSAPRSSPCTSGSYCRA